MTLIISGRLPDAARQQIAYGNRNHVAGALWAETGRLAAVDAARSGSALQRRAAAGRRHGRQGWPTRRARSLRGIRGHADGSALVLTMLSPKCLPESWL